MASPPGEMAAEKKASLECTRECLPSLTGSRLRCRVSFRQQCHATRFLWFVFKYVGWSLQREVPFVPHSSLSHLLRIIRKQGANMSRASKDNWNDRGGAEVRVSLSLSFLHPDLSAWSVWQRLQPAGWRQMLHPLQEMPWVLLFKRPVQWMLIRVVTVGLNSCNSKSVTFQEMNKGVFFLIK